MKKINSALVSVFNKDGLDEIIKLLHKHKIKIISTNTIPNKMAKIDVSWVVAEVLGRTTK